jgi:hypothetical protein
MSWADLLLSVHKQMKPGLKTVRAGEARTQDAAPLARMHCWPGSGSKLTVLRLRISDLSAQIPILKTAIPNLPLLLASAATWRWMRGLQGIHHGVEQVLPGSEGEVECQRTQVFEEGPPR